MDATQVLAAILRDARLRRAPQDEGNASGSALTRPEAPGKAFEIDQPTGVTALADPPRVIEGLDLETDDAAFDRDHPRGGPHPRADRRRREVTDVDLGADGDPARLQTSVDGIAGR